MPERASSGEVHGARSRVQGVNFAHQALDESGQAETLAKAGLGVPAEAVSQLRIGEQTLHRGTDRQAR